MYLEALIIILIDCSAALETSSLALEKLSVPHPPKDEASLQDMLTCQEKNRLFLPGIWGSAGPWTSEAH